MDQLIRDTDPTETREWRDALGSVLAFDGSARAEFLLGELVDEARRKGAPVPYSANTPYLNTIPPESEARHPGDHAIERASAPMSAGTRSRWCCGPTRKASELGGHIASFQSAATLYDVGFMHFWHGEPASSMAATWSTCRATPRRASTRARSWKAG